MVHRIAISINDRELTLINNLQKRLKIKKRSELIRVIVNRYDQLNNNYEALKECLQGYLAVPEKDSLSQAITNLSLSSETDEQW